MHTNRRKSPDANHPMANALETMREMLHELKCLYQNLSLETWMPADYPVLIARTMERIEKLREIFIQELFQPEDNGLILTAPRVCIIELGYAIHGHNTFNHGQAPVSRIMTGLENMTNTDLGNYSRTFQQIRSRKMGQTKYLDELRSSLYLRLSSSK